MKKEEETEKKKDWEKIMSKINELNLPEKEASKIKEEILHKEGENLRKQRQKISIFDFEPLKIIGKGAFGEVRVCRYTPTGDIIAIKKMKKEEMHRKKQILHVRAEKDVLSEAKNPWIVDLKFSFQDPKFLYLGMEFLPGGDLMSLLMEKDILPEQDAKFYAAELVLSIENVHKLNCIHRDLKPDNILIDLNNTIKLCDFGVGKEIKPGELIRDTCGTPAFVAPEILSDVSYDPFLTDIWSSGVVLYSMLSGFFPFIGNNDYELHKRITSGKFEDIQGISAECNDLIHRILEVDPSKRITLNEILNHKWMSNNSNNEQLFTNAERIIFSKLNVDYRIANKEDIIENFTYKNIDSELENENQNAMTRSVVNVPYNTKIGPYDDDEIFYEDLNIEDTIMRFLPKVNELNRNYEINNNSEADQGYTKKQKGRGLMSSFNNSYNKEEMKKEQVNKNNNNQSDNKANDNTSDFSSMNKKNTKKNIKDTVSTNSVTFCIDESAIKFVEDFGFRREFIMRSLEGNELNHATACYYLKLSLLNE